MRKSGNKIIQYTNDVRICLNDCSKCFLACCKKDVGSVVARVGQGRNAVDKANL